MEIEGTSSQNLELSQALTLEQLKAYEALGLSQALLNETLKLAPPLDLSTLLTTLKKIPGGRINFAFPEAPWQLVLFSGDSQALQQSNPQPDWDALLSPRGLTPCHYAAFSGSRACLTWVCKQLDGETAELLKQADKNGRTALHFAAFSGNRECLAWVGEQLDGETAELLKLVDNDGRTALHFAAGSGNHECFAWVCEQLDGETAELLKQADNDGRTALHFAAEPGNRECLAWVCKQLEGEAAALLKQADVFGCTVLHFATRSGNLAGFNYLVSQFPEPAYAIIKPPVKGGNGWFGLGKPTLKPSVLPDFRKPLGALLTQVSCDLMCSGPKDRSIQVLVLFAEEWLALMAKETMTPALLQASEQSEDKLTAFKNYSLLVQTSLLKPENTEQLRAHLNKLKKPQLRDDAGGPSNAPAVVKASSVAEVMDEKAEASVEETREVQSSQEKRIEELALEEPPVSASQTKDTRVRLDDAQKQAISEDLATSKDKLEEQRQKKAKFVEIISKLTTQITKLQAEKEQLKSSAQASADKDKRVAELEQAIKRLKSELSSKETKLAKLKKAHRELKEKYEQHSQIYESYQAARSEVLRTQQSLEKAEENMRKRKDENDKAVKRANALEDTLRTTSSILQTSNVKPVLLRQQTLRGGNPMKEEREVAWEELLKDILDKLLDASNQGIAESKQVIKKSGDDALAVKKFSFLTRASDLPGAKEKDGKLYVFAPEVSSAESLSAGAPILYKQSTSRIPAGSEFELSVAEERAEEVQRHLSTATTVQGGVSLSVFDVGLELGTSQEQVQSSAVTRTANNTQAQTIKPKLNLPPEGGDVKVNWYYVPKLRETTYQITVKGSVIVTFANKKKVDFDEVSGLFVVTDKKLGKLEKNERIISIEQLMQKAALPEGLSEFVSDLHSQPGQVSYQRMTKVVEFYERRLELLEPGQSEASTSLAIDGQQGEGSGSGPTQQAGSAEHKGVSPSGALGRSALFYDGSRRENAITGEAFNTLNDEQRTQVISAILDSNSEQSGNGQSSIKDMQFRVDALTKFIDENRKLRRVNSNDQNFLEQLNEEHRELCSIRAIVLGGKQVSDTRLRAKMLAIAKSGRYAEVRIDMSTHERAIGYSASRAAISQDNEREEVNQAQVSDKKAEETEGPSQPGFQ